MITLTNLQGETMYILEVKSTTAKHDIIGQLAKYFIAISLKLSIRLFSEVKMVAICPGYDKASLAGLKSIGAIPFLLNLKSMDIKAI